MVDYGPGMPVVILPVLDEIEALPWVLSRMPSDYEPLVVDNGSTDGSAECAAQLGARVIVEPQRGFGAACWAGVMAAPDDVICFMDCDGSLDPVDLHAVADPVIGQSADLVLGRRVAEKGAWPIHARLANRALSFEVRRRTGLFLRDLGPMRACTRSRLIDLSLKNRRSGWPLEMVLAAHQASLVITEVDIPYRPRVGRSKVTGTVRGTARAVSDMSALLR
jgi:glycosyltransferase involved in cell wall biosynthesis